MRTSLVGLLQEVPQVYLFVAAMAAGVLLHDLTGAASRQTHKNVINQL